MSFQNPSCFRRFIIVFCFFNIFYLSDHINSFADNANPNPIIIGHRGHGKETVGIVENSIESILSAIRDGADAVEFDVQLTKDNEVVVVHDPHLERITDIKTSGYEACINTNNLSDIRSLNLKDSAGTVFIDQQIPTLQELLLVLAKEQLKKTSTSALTTNIHIKVYDGLKGDWGGILNPCPSTNYLTLSRLVYQITRDLGFLNQTIFTSFDPRVLDELKNRDKNAQVGLLSLWWTSSSLDIAIQQNYNAIVASNKSITSDDAIRAKKNGLKTFIWFPDEQTSSQIQSVKSFADGIITDDLELAMQVLRPHKGFENSMLVVERSDSENSPQLSESIIAH